MQIFKKVPHNVFLLGLVSFFNDTASEMIYPIVPIFLTSILGAPIALVGLIEGTAEATASLSKFIFGYVSDFFQKRKLFVVAGYSLGAVSKLLIGFASSWPLVLFARFIDRTGKGARTAARDSLLLQDATTYNKGFIFGFHRAFDSVGAVLGPLLALGLLSVLHENIRLVFFIAAVPAFIAVLLVILFVHEQVQQKREKHAFPKLSWNLLQPKLRLFLLVNFVFALGNSADSFLILRAKQLGLTTTLAVLTYVLYNLSQTIFATPAGSLADKIGAKKVFAMGLIIFSLVYFLFGAINNPFWIWFIFPFYGIYIAFTDGVSKAYISEFISEKESGTYFGLQQTLLAVGTFFASLFGGFLWSTLGSYATFWYGSVMAAVAFILFYFYTKLRISKVEF